MTLKAEGPCVVTAAMIETGHDVEIMNPDHVICNLDAGAKISMELTALLNYVPITVVKEENVMSIVDNANVMTIFTEKAAKKLNVNQIVINKHYILYRR